MNRKSELHKLLDYLPVINPNTNEIFFYPEVEEDKLFLDKSNYKRFWTWQIHEGKSSICSGFWRMDRNAYVITEKPIPQRYDGMKYIFVPLLPRDFDTLREYSKRSA